MDIRYVGEDLNDIAPSLSLASDKSKTRELPKVVPNDEIREEKKSRVSLVVKKGEQKFFMKIRIRDSKIVT